MTELKPLQLLDGRDWAYIGSIIGPMTVVSMCLLAWAVKSCS